MTTKQAALIAKLERHRAGPIKLTQAECVTLAETIAALLNRIELQEAALRAVDAGIWHDKKANTRGLAAGAAVAHLVEAALGKRKLKK
jgi:hypothetical protein